MQKQLFATRQQRQLQILIAHAETVASELDDVAIALVQIGAVLQRAERLIAQRFHARVEIVGLHRIEQFGAQAFAQFLELDDQRIARKEGVQRVLRLQFFCAFGQALQNAQCRIVHALRAALAFIGERLALRLEGLQQLLALGDDVGQKLLVLAKLALDFFELHQQTCELFVAAFRCLGQAQRAHNALREQRQLCRKLRHVFGATQTVLALLGARTHLVEPRVDARDPIHHLRALCGVVNLEAGHQLREHVERARHVRHVGQRGGQLRHGGDRLRGLVELLQLVDIGLQRRIGGDEACRALRYFRLRLVHRRGHRVDGIGIHIAQLACGHQLPAHLAEFFQRAHVVVDAVPVAGAHALEQRRVLRGHFAHRPARRLANALYLFIFVDDRIARGHHAAQHVVHAGQLRRVDPQMALEHDARGVDEALVARQRDLGRGDFLAHAVDVGDAAHQLGIADAAQKTVALRLAGRKVFRGKRCAPDLHRMHARGLVAVGRKDHDAAVFEARVAVAHNRRLQRTLDHVVLEQRHAPALGLVEDVEHIFAVGRANAAAVTHALHVLFERTVLAVLQVVTTGENDAVIVRQLNAGAGNRVHAQHLFGQRVEDQIAKLLFAVRLNLQQDHAADGGVFKHRIVERLVAFHHRLAVDAEPVVGVVLDLHGERSAQRLDKHLVENIHVRVATLHQLIAARALPFEVERCGGIDVALATVVDVADRLVVGRNRPTEHAHIADAIANLKARQQLAVAHHQLHQARVLVVGVELLKILHKALDAEEAVLELHRHHFVAVLALFQSVQRKHVFHARGLLEAHEHVVAKQQKLAHLRDVAAHAVVFGAHTHAADDFHLAAAEFFQAFFVELAHQGFERFALRGKAFGQHFVRAATSDGLIHNRIFLRDGIGLLGHFWL